MRILAVDDEPGNLMPLQAFFEAEDAHEVVTASSGAEALAIIEAADDDFDCLFLDIQMPQMSGIALCEHILALPDYQHVPIIMLTAMSQQCYIEQAFSVGASDYVTKPFDLIELRYRLRAAGRVATKGNRAADMAKTTNNRWFGSPAAGVKPHPDEPLVIDGVERIVGYSAFENFALALSHTKLLSASAIAVKIVAFKDLYRAVDAGEMLTILQSAAQAIVGRVPGQGNLVSYRGNGVFLCLNPRGSGTSSGHRSIVVNGKAEIQLAFGEEIPLVPLSKTGTLMALSQAVESIECAPASLIDFAEVSRRVLRNQLRTQEQAHFERLTYQVVLDEIIQEERRLLR
jgi:CheY-like chemotaxis protein